MKTTLHQALSAMKARITKAIVPAAMGIALLLLGNTPVKAADMCFLDDYGYTLVGKNFSFPAAGACKAFNGYELGTNCIVSGTACGTSDNGLVAFHLTNSCPFVNYQGVASFRISRFNSYLPQAGYGYSSQINGGGFAQWHNKTVTCPSPRPLN